MMNDDGVVMAPKKKMNPNWGCQRRLIHRSLRSWLNKPVPMGSIWSALAACSAN